MAPPPLKDILVKYVFELPAYCHFKCVFSVQLGGGGELNM